MVVVTTKREEKINNTNKRQANFELLRIISMFFIVVFHFHDWGGLANIQSNFNNKLFGIFIGIFGNLGNNLFVLISGYFLINSKFKVKKFLKIYFQIYFYSIIITSMCYFLKIGDFSLGVIKQALFPISYSAYWFATTYLGLYLLSPYINKLLKNMGKEKHRVLIIILGIMVSFIPTIVLNSVPWTSNLIWFVYLYIIAVYINLYNIEFLKGKIGRHGLLIIGVISIMFLLSVLGLLVLKHNISNGDYTFYFNRMNSVPMLALSLLIFMFFKNINIKENIIINFLAKSSFAVYLIHINTAFRTYLFYNIIKIQNFYNSNTIILIVYVLGVSVAIYIICSIIDFIRRTFVEEPIFRIKKFDKYFDKIDNLIN